jgi:hypothetical protein
MNCFSGHYENWRNTRIAGINKYFNTSLLAGKELLELGCGYADIGIKFRESYGCKLIASDARDEHLCVINEKHPDITTLKFDCDKDNLSKKYDVILHWGVLYHIKNIDNHLKNICENCDYLLLETEVMDSVDDKDIIFINEDASYDQAHNGIGCRPSPAYVERLLVKNGFSFQLIVDPILDSDVHTYSWKHNNDKTIRNGLRRFWIAWKADITSPL